MDALLHSLLIFVLAAIPSAILCRVVITLRDGRHLLPGEIENATWQKATDWAASIGGELPDQRDREP